MTMRFTNLAVLACMLTLPAVAPRAEPTGGTISGTVIVTRNGARIKNATDLWVYLLPMRSVGAPKPTPAKATIGQSNLTFIPHSAVVPLRSSVAFPNNDREEHNVFSPTEPGFDLDRYRPGKSKSQIFEFEGEYDIYCDIHAGMWAQVKVVDSDHIVQVAKDGTFQIANVPAGKYKLVAWRPKVSQSDTNEVKETVVVEIGRTTTLPGEVKLPAPPPELPHKRKNGAEYPPCSTVYDRSKCKS